MLWEVVETVVKPPVLLSRSLGFLRGFLGVLHDGFRLRFQPFHFRLGGMECGVGVIVQRHNDVGVSHVLGAKFHLPHGLVCSYTLPVTIETVADVLPEKVRYTGRILGVDFPKNVSPQQIGRLTAQAYRAFRDRLYDGKTCSFPIDESNIHTLAQEICKEAFAPLTPVKVDEALVVEMLKKIG